MKAMKWLAAIGLASCPSAPTGRGLVTPLV